MCCRGCAPLPSTATLFTLMGHGALCEHRVPGGGDCIPAPNGTRFPPQVHRKVEAGRDFWESFGPRLDIWTSGNIICVISFSPNCVKYAETLMSNFVYYLPGKNGLWNLLISFSYNFSKCCHAHFEVMAWHHTQPSFTEGEDHLRARWWHKQAGSRAVLGADTQSVRGTGLFCVMDLPLTTAAVLRAVTASPASPEILR